MATRRLLVALAALLAVAALLVAWAAPAPATAQATSVHLALGNPSGAAPDPTRLENFLIVRDQYALGYRCGDGIALWASWRLVAGDLGDEDRGDFRQDTSLPPGCYVVRDADYVGSGYNRGHLVPSADRTATEADNRATFLFTNALPQSPNNNGGPWLDMENLGRELAIAGDEVYTVAGPEGELGRLPAPGGPLRIPARTWRALLAVPASPGDPAERVTTATRLTAISVPNDKDDPSVRRSDDWELYATSVDAIEAATGLDLFGDLHPKIQRVLEARIDLGARPYTIAVTGTASLTATVGAAFAPLRAWVRGPGGEPIPGVVVAFAALGDAANASLGGDVVAMATTDAAGVATVAAVAGPVAGSYIVEASIAGVYEPAVFELTNVPSQGALQPVIFLPMVSYAASDN